MRVFFSGIGGVGIGPLAQVALDAGYDVVGSDMHASEMTRALEARDVIISDDQSGDFLERAHTALPIDWYVHSSAITPDHPEYKKAESLGIHVAKRDELIRQVLSDKNLKLIAVAGTHGKTTTTAMMVWVCKQLGIPVSYSIGTSITFGPSGVYNEASEYFIYECDEYDRNFLHFSPDESLIVSVDYDHVDTYPTRADYLKAFEQFALQSHHVTSWQSIFMGDMVAPDDSWLLDENEVADLPLAGEHNRRNATLVLKSCEYLHLADTDQIRDALGSFPGTGRRFERLAENLYSDYGHHPIEIAATLQSAQEMSDRVVLVYQPHQNVRQHEVRDQYTDCMKDADEIYWLPTYLSREDPTLEVLTPQQLSEQLENKDSVKIAALDDELWQHISSARDEGKLVLCMGAGNIDEWVRRRLTSSPSN